MIMASGDDELYIPLELINTILVNLPVKSIVRFKSVCKEWKTLLKTPSFSKEYFRNNSFLLLHEYNEENMLSTLRLLDHNMETVEFLSIPRIESFTQRKWRIIDSCKGILCVEGSDNMSATTKLWLWNPVIRQVREIPNTMDGSWCVYNVGFGFSSAINDYKIVRFYKLLVIRIDENHVWYRVRAQVYSLSTGSWKQLRLGDLLKLEDIVDSLSKPVSNDGNIFWLAKNMLIWFDIVSEEFAVAPIPIEDGIYPIGLSVYEKTLAIHNRLVEENGTHVVTVWVMGEVATLICRLDQVSGDYGDSTILCVWRNEIVFLENKHVTAPKCSLYLFNLDNDEERRFNCSNDCDYCDAFSFEKSMVSVLDT